MAQKVQVITYSDLTGEEGASTVTLSFSGSSYEIDLTGKEQDALTAVLQPYIASGRRVSGRNGRTTGRRAAKRSKTTDGPDSRDVRAWAAKNGLKVSDRGRIPAGIMERYVSEN